MTEEEWLSCEDWTVMLNFLENRVSQRKLLLSNLALCGALAPIIRDKQCLRTFKVLEDIADGAASENDQEEAQNWARSSLSQCHPSHRGSYFARCAVYNLTLVTTGHVVLSQSGNYTAALDVTEQNKTGIRETGMVGLRCVNSYYFITLNPTWLTSTVLALAQQMYDSRDFSAMPILADALQDAGCDSLQILEHCREAGPHVRGCFVVDLLLNKA